MSANKEVMDIDYPDMAPPAKAKVPKCRYCTQCCAVYCLVCALLLITFTGALLGDGSVNFQLIFVEYDDNRLLGDVFAEKRQACYLAALYYLIVSAVLAVHGFVWPKFCGAKASNNGASKNGGRNQAEVQYLLGKYGGGGQYDGYSKLSTEEISSIANGHGVGGAADTDGPVNETSITAAPAVGASGSNVAAAIAAAEINLGGKPNTHRNNNKNKHSDKSSSSRASTASTRKSVNSLYDDEDGESNE